MFVFSLTGIVVNLLLVGVIIGKAGETIRYIQLQSGAKIQVTRDHEAEPGALTRQVELSGKPEQISKAEQLIKEVLAEVLLIMLTAFCFVLHFSSMLQCLILHPRPMLGHPMLGHPVLDLEAGNTMQHSQVLRRSKLFIYSQIILVYLF
jgi:hypothetical protein